VSPGTSPNRRFAGEALAAGAFVLVAQLVLRLSGLIATGAFNDDGVYVSLGKALAGGSGYHLVYLVGDPVALKFPPGLPALLAAAWSLTGTLKGVRAAVAVLDPLVIGGTVTLLWWLGRRRLAAPPLPLAFFAVGPFLLDPAIQLYNLPIAEPEFMLGWAGTLVLAYAVLETDTARAWTAVALGLVLAATTLFRSAGIALIAAVLLACALRRQWRTLAVVAASALVPLAIWHVVHARIVAQGPMAHLPDEIRYWEWLPLGSPMRMVGLVAHAVWDNTLLYGRALGAYLLVPTVLGVLVLGGAGLVALAGAIRGWRDHAVVSLSAAGVLAAALVWPFAQDRLVLVVLPFAGLLAAAQVGRALSHAAPRTRVVWQIALLMVAAGVGLRQLALRHAAALAFVHGVQPPLRDVSPASILTGNSRFIYGVSDWVRRHTDPADRVLVDFPSGVFLYTGRQTMQASPAESGLTPSVFRVPGGYLSDRIRRDSISVVILGLPGGGLERDIQTFLTRCPGVLVPADGRPSGARVFPRFFRVTRDSACAGPAAFVRHRPPDRLRALRDLPTASFF
jgi:hypothetical protein